MSRSFIRLFAVMLSSLSMFLIPCDAIGATRFSAAPLNPDFLWMMKKISEGKTPQTKTEDGYPLGYRPSPMNLSHLKGVNVFQNSMKNVRSFASTYDLRQQNKVTPVRNQNPYGTCWAHSALASVESISMPGENLDLSEWHLAYFAYSGADSFTSWTGLFDNGGDDFKAAAILARWTGAVYESDCPYLGSYPTGSETVRKHLQQVLYMGNASTRYPIISSQNVKYAVTNYGGVSVGIYWSNSYYNPSECSYYYSGSNIANHGVLIAGWDDSYSRNNFSPVPPGDGAWIIKNSWGTTWGESGYFYASYYTPLDTGAAFIVESPSNYGRVYQYDPLGWVISVGYGSNTAWMANVFTALANESIKAVSFYTAAANSSYEIHVYTDVTGGPTTGNHALGGQSGSIESPGYHTIQLSSPVNVNNGSKFSVVIKLNTPGYNYPIPVEDAESGYSDKASASPGQSYVGSDGSSWNDITFYPGYSTANVCFKAFATSSGAPDPTATPTPTPTPSATPTPTPTGTLTPTPTPTPTPSGTLTPSPTPTPTATGTLTPTPTPTESPIPTDTPTGEPSTPTPTNTPDDPPEIPDTTTDIGDIEGGVLEEEPEDITDDPDVQNMFNTPEMSSEIGSAIEMWFGDIGDGNWDYDLSSAYALAVNTVMGKRGEIQIPLMIQVGSVADGEEALVLLFGMTYDAQGNELGFSLMEARSPDPLGGRASALEMSAVVEDGGDFDGDLTSGGILSELAIVTAVARTSYPTDTPAPSYTPIPSTTIAPSHTPTPTGEVLGGGGGGCSMGGAFILFLALLPGAVNLLRIKR